MNFKPLDKILLVLLMLAVIFIAAILIGSALSLVDVSAIQYVVALAHSNTLACIITGLIGLILLALAFRMFIAMSKRREPERPSSALLSSSETGSVYVALSAIDSLVQRHVRENQLVRDCETHVTAVEDGVILSLRICVQFETVVPTFVEQLQSSLKACVETNSGINVKNIQILIISAPLPPQTNLPKPSVK